MLGVALLGAGWDWGGGSSPQHPCSVWFLFLGPCLSAHLPLPDLRRCPCLDLPTPKGLAPGSHLVLMWCMDLWSLSLCRIKIAPGLPWPLPPAAWGLGTAEVGKLPHTILAGVHTDLCSVDSELSQETHTCV